MHPYQYSSFVHCSSSMSISSDQAYQELNTKYNCFFSYTQETRNSPQGRNQRIFFFFFGLLSSVLPPRLWREYKTNKFSWVTAILLLVSWIPAS